MKKIEIMDFTSAFNLIVALNRIGGKITIEKDNDYLIKFPLPDGTIVWMDDTGHLDHYFDPNGLIAAELAKAS